MREGLWSIVAVCGLLLGGCGDQGERRGTRPQPGGPVKAELPQGKADDPAATAPAPDAPEGFPKDLPLPGGARAIASTTEAKSATLHLETTGDPKAVADSHAAAMKAKGWQEESSAPTPQGAMRTFRKGKRTAAVTVAGEGGKTLIHIVVQADD